MIVHVTTTYDAPLEPDLAAEEWVASRARAWR
jgi:hypothetical protein